MATRLAARSGARARSWRVAIDVGGTFTDGVAIGEDGETIVVKVPSTPADPASALVAAVRELSESGVPLRRLSAVFHGTTVATNAAITGGLARVVLIATEGYRDILKVAKPGTELYQQAQLGLARVLLRTNEPVKAAPVR